MRISQGSRWSCETDPDISVAGFKSPPSLVCKVTQSCKSTFPSFLPVLALILLPLADVMSHNVVPIFRMAFH